MYKLLVLFLVFTYGCYEPPTMKETTVGLIGNSHIERVSAILPYEVETDIVWFSAIDAHKDTEDFERILRSGKDVIVLQDGFNGAVSESLPYAIQIAQESGSEVILFQSWGHCNGDFHTQEIFDTYYDYDLPVVNAGEQFLSEYYDEDCVHANNQGNLQMAVLLNNKIIELLKLDKSGD